ncbi:hypothetical protein SAMD00019534_008900 [Acytostelium subglobosum LB1]|uniref:hypothetical protein n=1 Tax=Acytostelium subglobosum LB1 TaxID=1410327 RepID=UPI000644A836|nr:hypothetical protein SAMD00019534_008900 [Acytostelium subglobosum LB1]GAM17715.1 hypothetical protein SAMD00019534_008900 [Acytostelium subglobosum LB1]|eukprot:XP_012758311.1 hypothetical protein SAMD00019534_008900 [Acytostelium subglobosum LB1]
MSMSTMSEPKSESVIQQASSLKEKGNQEYSRAAWNDAYTSYKAGINLLLPPVDNASASSSSNGDDNQQQQRQQSEALLTLLYCNRSATCLQMGRHADGLEDAMRSAASDPTFARAYLRAGDCCIGMKRYKEAKEHYLQCILNIKVDPEDKTMTKHNQLLTQATNGLNNSKMKLFYDPILRGNDAHYSKLELRYLDNVKEKSLIATVDIKKGDIVFVDTPFAHIAHPLCVQVNKDIQCYHCMGCLEGEKVACRGGCNALFCSLECSHASWNTYHIQQCCKEDGNNPIAKYRQMIKGAPSEPQLLLAERILATISQSLKQRKAKNCNLAFGTAQHLKRGPLMRQQARFNGDNLVELQAQYQPVTNLLKEAYGAKESGDAIQHSMDSILQEELDKLLSNDFFDNLLGLINFNSSATVVKIPASLQPPAPSVSLKAAKGKSKAKTVAAPPKRLDMWGVGLFPIFSCMNHSCLPNIELSNERIDGVTCAMMVVRAKKNIKAGQEILNTYCDETMPTRERQEQLKSQYDFQCKCSKCN